MGTRLSSVSIVIPCYRSADTLADTVDGIRAALADTYKLQFVLVNDGSPDDTWEELRRLHAAHPDVTAINLRRNFGEHNAVLTGLRHIKGDAAVIVDDDLQHPASEIHVLLEKLEEGYDVVYGRYERKQHSPFRNFGSWFNDKAANIVLHKPADLYLSSFKALRADLVQQMCRYEGPFVYIDGLVLWLTNSIAQVVVKHLPRQSGSSNYNIIRLIRLHLNLLTGFSIMPLRLSVIGGVLMALIGTILAVVSIVEKLANPDLPIGWASLIVCILLIGGITMFMLGAIGEYVGRIFLLLNRKPQSAIRDILE